jgi:hypothetical protein
MLVHTEGLLVVRSGRVVVVLLGRRVQTRHAVVTRGTTHHRVAGVGVVVEEVGHVSRSTRHQSLHQLVGHLHRELGLLHNRLLRLLGLLSGCRGGGGRLRNSISARAGATKLESTSAGLLATRKNNLSVGSGALNGNGGNLGLSNFDYLRGNWLGLGLSLGNNNRGSLLDDGLLSNRLLSRLLRLGRLGLPGTVGVLCIGVSSLSRHSGGGSGLRRDLRLLRSSY